jgi:hypothetical protein
METSIYFRYAGIGRRYRCAGIAILLRIETRMLATDLGVRRRALETPLPSPINHTREDRVLSHPANRARCSCSIAMNFTLIPCLGLLLCTAARARTSPVVASISNGMKVPAGGGSGVRMNSPPKPRLSTSETALFLNLCQATIVPFAKRG